MPPRRSQQQSLLTRVAILFEAFEFEVLALMIFMLVFYTITSMVGNVCASSWARQHARHTCKVSPTCTWLLQRSRGLHMDGTLWTGSTEARTIGPYSHPHTCMTAHTA